MRSACVYYACLTICVGLLVLLCLIVFLSITAVLTTCCTSVYLFTFLYIYLPTYLLSMCFTDHQQVNGLLPFAIIESLLNLTLAQFWPGSQNTPLMPIDRINPNQYHNTTTSNTTTSTISSPHLTVFIMAEEHDRSNPNPGVAQGRSFDPQVI